MMHSTIKRYIYLLTGAVMISACSMTKGVPDDDQLFIVKNSWRQMESFTYEELERAVRECVEAEEAVKTGRMNDQMSVEMLIVMFTM